MNMPMTVGNAVNGTATAGVHTKAALTSVVVVLRETNPALLSLSHVSNTISDCLDWSTKWTIVKARNCGYEHLLWSRLLLPWEEFSFLKDEYYWQMVRKNAIKSAAKNGEVADLQRLTASRGEIDEETGLTIKGFFGTTLVELAAHGGHLHVLKWLHEQYGTAIDWCGIAIAYAVHFDHLDVAQWLTEIRYENEDYDDIICEELEDWPDPKSLTLEMKQWQHKHGYLNILRERKYAAALGRLDILQWLHEVDTNQQSLIGIYLAFHVASSQGHLHIMQWIYDTYYKDTIDNNGSLSREDMWQTAMKNAALHGHLDIIRWLDETQPSYRYSKEPMNNGAAGGHLQIVKFLHTNRREGCDRSAMDKAAKGGFLEVVEWLHFNRDEGCTTDAMDDAAANGHLNVVQWLHDHRSEGCTRQAMNGAAQNGYLEVVKWLHANRFVGSSTWAMEGAIRNGHLEVVKWLYENNLTGYNGSELFVRLHEGGLFAKAAREGHLELVKWLYENNHHGNETEAIVRAAENGHLQIVQWLYHNMRIPTERIRDAVTHATVLDQFEVLLFLHERDVAVSRRVRSKYFCVKSFEFAQQFHRVFIEKWLYKQYGKLIDRERARGLKASRSEAYGWLMARFRRP